MYLVEIPPGRIKEDGQGLLRKSPAAAWERYASGVRPTGIKQVDGKSRT